MVTSYKRCQLQISYDPVIEYRIWTISRTCTVNAEISCINVEIVFTIWTFIFLKLSCSLMHVCGYFWGEMLYIYFTTENVSKCYFIYLFYIFFLS